MIPDVPRHTPDWARLVSLDFETFYSAEYTLSKMSTSEYVRDPRFKAQMVGIKIGNAKTKIVLAKNIGLELAKINWATHSLLCHNTPFDGFILHQHYGIHPLFYYDSLAMARGLHSNDIGASLHEVSIHYGGQGKIEGSLEETKGVLVWDKAMNAKTGIYCTNDVEEMLRVFKLMLPKMPADEIDLIDLTCRMFCDPVLKVDILRVEKELARELAHRDDLLSSIVDLDEYDMTKLLKGKEKLLPPKERDTLMVKRIIGSSERFAELIRAEGVEPPLKISPAWMKLDKATRESPEGQDRKYAYAFAKDDLAFINMPDMCDEWGYDLNDPEQVKLMVAKQARLQALVDTRIAVKSTSNITRAERFLTAGANGMPLPIGYAYYRAHTGRFGGNNKMNFQNLKRGGELRLSILAPKGHMIAVADSGQIECVAHDSPVLTRDRGYIRIQDIVLTDLLWDGVEWVSHDGVVCTGFKEVITYDGVTATGNHKVWLDDGTTCTLEEVSQSATGQGLAVGGLRGQAIRFMDSDERANKPNWHDQAQMPMQRMFTAIRSANGGFTAWQIYAVQKLWRKAVEKFDGAWAQVRRDLAEVQRPDASKLDDVRSTRDQMQVCFAGRVHTLDGGASASSRLQRCGDRSGEQQWALRTGQPATGNAAAEREQPKYNSVGPVRWAASAAHHVHGAASRMWVWLRHHWGFSTPRVDRRTNHPAIPHSVQKAFVYDILNAGPRHRFTASDRIVSNCRVNAWLWGQDDLVEAFRVADTWDKKTMGVATGENRDAYCRFADDVYGREVTTNDSLERFVGKVCIAEGELVLTDRGLVPIHLISNEDRLWDGVEWITHDGVIDQGVKEVITYDGLTATPDHEVFTEDGRIIPLGQAASEMVRLQSTGVEGQAIWFCDDHIVADTPRKRLSVRQGPVLAERDNKIDSVVEPRTGKDYFVSQKWSETDSTFASLGATVRRYFGEVYQPITQALGKLWRAGHQEPIRFADGVHPVGRKESPTPELQGGGDRQDGQRRALRAGQSTLSDQTSEYPKSTQYSEDYVARQTGSAIGIPQPVQPELDISTNATGADRRANLRQVRTYDVVNAGPRKRFTVSGKLVLNCVLGLGYMMGAPKLQLTFAKGALGGPPVYFELERCQAIVNAYRQKNSKIIMGWKICDRIIEDMANGREGEHGPIRWEANTIWLPNGMALKYPDLRKAIGDKGWPEWTYGSTLKGVPIRKKIYSGLLNENIVQALARIIVMWQMLQSSRKYRVVMTTHDEFASIAKSAQAERCFAHMNKWMKTAPAWCADIPLNSEGGVDVNYSK